MFDLPQHIAVNLKLLLVIIVVLMVTFIIFSIIIVDRFEQTKHIRETPTIEQPYTQNFLAGENN